MNHAFRRSLPILVSLCFLHLAHAHEKQWPEKRLRQVWPTAQSFTSRQMTLTADQTSKLSAGGVKLGSEDRSPIFYFAKSEAANSSQSKSLGVIFFVDEYGSNGKMEISLAIGADGHLKKVDIWDHSENSAVAQTDFLKQFIDKTSNDTFVPNKDYMPIPDAIQASQAVAFGVEKGLKITNIVFEKK